MLSFSGIEGSDNFVLDGVGLGYYFHDRVVDSQRVTFGEQLFGVNHFRNILEHVFILDFHEPQQKLIMQF